LLEAETKLMHIIHFKAFLFYFDNVLIVKYMYIFVIFVSQAIACDVKPGSVTFVVYADFRIVNVDILPPGACMFVFCECCVLSGRGLCDGPITRPEESYRLWCVVLCDLETS